MNNLIKQIVESKFNFNIDIKDNERQDLLSKSKYNSVSQNQLYLDLYIVDLGLPSKTIWCKYNLGVDINLLDKAENWFGNYYAWGELKPKDLYIWDNYKFDNNVSYMKKYNEKDNLILLLLEDDAAYLNLHIGNLKFRIPSKKLFEELLKYTISEHIENYYNVKNLSGRIFKSKINDNEIFIPVAGFCANSGLSNDGIEANLWSSNLNDYTNFAWYFFFDPGRPGISYYGRCYGMPIRPVLYIN